MRILCFSRHQNRLVNRIGQKSAFLQTENRTVSDNQLNFIIYFVGRRFFSEEFCCLFPNFFFEGKWTATLPKVKRNTTKSEPHDLLFVFFRTNYFFTRVDQASGPHGLSRWTTCNEKWAAFRGVFVSDHQVNHKGVLWRTSWENKVSFKTYISIH